MPHIPARPTIAATLALAVLATPVAARPRDDARPPRAKVKTPRGGLDVVGDRDTRPRRIRVMLGPQFNPAFPGDDRMRLSPIVSIAKARGDDPFPFGAPGDGNALTLIHAGRFEAGPMFQLTGKRDADNLGGGLPRVSRSLEPGVFAQVWPVDAIRLRADVRHGVTGHNGLISQLAADYVARDGDRWLVSLGPRVQLSDRRYQRAWFGVDADTAARTGLARFDPSGGAHAVGATGRAIVALDRRWSVQAVGRWDRLIGDAGASPIIGRADSRNQVSAGLALGYTFTIGR